MADLRVGDKPLNQRLQSWWVLDFAGLRAEVAKVWKRDIAVAERDQWERWLADQSGAHDGLTRRIVDLETELNERVYRLYGLSAAERAIVERLTAYPLGAV